MEKIDPSKLCIAVVDMQPSYLKNILENDKARLIESHLSLLERCVTRDIPVIVFEYQDSCSVNYECTIPLIRNKINQSRRNYFSEKEFDDGFTCYPLVDKKLQEWGTESICFTGINAAACVLDSAQGAFGLGYKVLTTKDLIGDRTGIGGITHAKRWFLENGIYFQSHKELLRELHL